MIGQAAKPQRNPGILVIPCGLVTTIISLVIVFFLADTEFNVMAGLCSTSSRSALIGAGSGMGYYLGSKWTNSKIRGVFVGIVFFISIAGFIASEFITYLAFVDPNKLTFLRYIQVTAEGWSFENRDGTPGEPLGKWGYFFVGLQAVGFSLGAMFPVLLLTGAPYRDRCQYYLKKNATTYILSTGDESKLNKKKKAATE